MSTNNHGGRRAGAGRPAHDQPLRSYSIRLTEEQARLLRLWGRGDMAAGLRWLIAAARPLIRRAAEPGPPRSSG